MKASPQLFTNNTNFSYFLILARDKSRYAISNIYYWLKIYIVPFLFLTFFTIQASGQGNTNGNPILEKIISSWVASRLEKVLAAEAPLILDQHAAFSEAPTPEHFNPVNLYSTADLNRKLKGDNAIDMTFYCSKFGGHRPSKNVPYKLARASGSMSKPISALLLKGNLAHISPYTLIAIDWKLQSGLRYDEFSEIEKPVIDTLISEYKRQITGDAFDRFVDNYNKKWGRVFPLNVILAKMLSHHPELEKIVFTALKLTKERDVMLNAAIAEDRLPDMLYEVSGDGTPAQLGAYTKSDSSRWVTIMPGVIGRYIVDSGFLKSNTLQLRVSENANVTLNDILYADDELLMAYPIDVDAQIPIISPILDECPKTSASVENFSLYQQKQPNWCWAAVAEMMMESADGRVIMQCEQAAKLHGRPKSECCGVGGDNDYDIKNSSGCDGGSTLDFSFNNFGYTYHLWTLPLSKYTIENEICNNRLIGYQIKQYNPNHHGMKDYYIFHYRIIHAYDDTNGQIILFVYDPALNQDISMSYYRYFDECTINYYDVE